MQVRGWLKPSIEDRPTLRRRLEKNKPQKNDQQRFFVFREFWMNSSESPSDLGNGQKQVDSVDSEAENASMIGILTSPSEFSSQNGAGLTGLDPDRAESSESNGENIVGLEWNQLEANLGESSNVSSPVSPLSPVEKHISQTTSKRNLRFNVGDRVRYIGSNTNLLNQYAGTLAVYEVSGDTYSCLKPDGKLTSWIEFADMELVEVSV